MKLHPQQQAYKEAKQKRDALYQLSGEKQNALLDTWEGDLDDNDEIDRYCAIAAQIEFELGLPQATQALRQAEQELIAWALDVLKQDPRYNPQIEEVLRSPYTTIREKAFEALVRL